ncbi:unnamed protein product [Caretta caretta]
MAHRRCPRYGRSSPVPGATGPIHCSRATFAGRDFSKERKVDTSIVSLGQFCALRPHGPQVWYWGPTAPTERKLSPARLLPPSPAEPPGHFQPWLGWAICRQAARSITPEPLFVQTNTLAIRSRQSRLEPLLTWRNLRNCHYARHCI